ncbi:hypothetical protein H1C71_007495 [Ictidomys tridecemlineatus]|nr:hypothetical protein H1C71_007495 [Ictidomys tridecemlineatus]
MGTLNAWRGATGPLVQGRNGLNCEALLGHQGRGGQGQGGCPSALPLHLSLTPLVFIRTVAAPWGPLTEPPHGPGTPVPAAPPGGLRKDMRPTVASVALSHQAGR